MGFLQFCPPSYVSSYSQPKRRSMQGLTPLPVRRQMMPTMIGGDKRSMAGKNLLLVSFHDILGVERGEVRCRGGGKREECSGRPRSRRRGGFKPRF